MPKGRVSAVIDRRPDGGDCWAGCSGQIFGNAMMPTLFFFFGCMCLQGDVTDIDMIHTIMNERIQKTSKNVCVFHGTHCGNVWVERVATSCKGSEYTPRLTAYTDRCIHPIDTSICISTRSIP